MLLQAQWSQLAALQTSCGVHSDEACTACREADAPPTSGRPPADSPPPPPGPDLHFGLLHQKLQMLNVCIHHRKHSHLSTPHTRPRPTRAQRPAAESQQAKQKLAETERRPRSGSTDRTWDSDWDWGDGDTASQRGKRTQQSRAPAAEASSLQRAEEGHEAAEGVAGFAGDLRLLAHPHVRMHVPLTQHPPQLTEDLLLEQEAVLTAMGVRTD